MQDLLMQFAQGGLACVMAAIFMFFLYKQNINQQVKLDKENEWKIQVIENDTKATLTLTETLLKLTEVIKSLDKRIP